MSNVRYHPPLDGALQVVTPPFEAKSAILTNQTQGTLNLYDGFGTLVGSAQANQQKTITLRSQPSYRVQLSGATSGFAEVILTTDALAPTAVAGNVAIIPAVPDVTTNGSGTGPFNIFIPQRSTARRFELLIANRGASGGTYTLNWTFSGVFSNSSAFWTPLPNQSAVLIGTLAVAQVALGDGTGNALPQFMVLQFLTAVLYWYEFTLIT